MAATVGKLRTILSLNSAAFGRGMSLAVRQVESFQSSITSAARKIATFGGALTGIAGTAGLVVLGKHALDSGEELADLSDQLQISTEQLSAFKFGAATAGMTLDDVATAIAKMQSVIAEGGEPLKRLGLDQKSLMQLGGAKQLDSVTDAIMGISNQAQRMRSVREMFGRGGRDMIEFIQGGSRGFKEMGEEAARFGGIFDRVAVEKLQMAKVDIRKIHQMLETLAMRLLEWLPIVTSLAKKAFEDFLGNTERIAKAVDGAIDTVVEFGAKILDAFGDAETAALRFETVLLDIQIVAKELALLPDTLLTGDPRRGKTMASKNAGIIEGAIQDIEKLQKRQADIFQRIMSNENKRAGGGGFGQFGQFLRDMWGDAKSAVQRYAEAVAKAAAESRKAASTLDVDFLGRTEDAVNNVGKMLTDLRDDLLKKTLTRPQQVMRDLMGGGASLRELAFAQNLLGFDAQIEALKNDKGATPRRFGIGFREIRAEDLGGIRPGTVFGEQAGEILKTEKDQLTELKKIAAGILSLGQLNN